MVRPPLWHPRCILAAFTFIVAGYIGFLLPRGLSGQSAPHEVHLPFTTLARRHSPAAVTTRVSVASDGAEANNSAFGFDISGDGRFVAFDSIASNLVPDDRNAVSDVFVHDRLTGATNIVSVAAGGGNANADSLHPSLSADGRYVAFESYATNLVPHDTNGQKDIFLFDRETAETVLVSVGPLGVPGDAESLSASLSANGRTVAFASYSDTLAPGDTNQKADIFVRDMERGLTWRASVSTNGSQATHESLGPALSADGRFVVFRSRAANLVTGDTNSVSDVFVHDLQTGRTARVSLSSDGTQGYGHSGGGDLSADGRYVTFGSEAANLVPGDTNGVADVFVHDRVAGETVRVSVASDGTEASGLSASGTLSADGRYVGFASVASNLVSDDNNRLPDLFFHDREGGSTRRVNLSTTGVEADGVSFGPCLSAGGGQIAFMSAATTLVAGDKNWSTDIFVRQFY